MRPIEHRGGTLIGVRQRIAELSQARGSTNFAWMSAGQVVYGISQWGVLSVLANLGGATAVGELALAMAIVTPVFQLVRLRLRDVVATDVDEKVPLSDYLTTASASLLVGLVISLLAGIVLDVSSTVLGVVAIMAIARGIEGMSHVSYGHQQRTGLMAPVGRSLIVRGSLNLVLLGIGFGITDSVVWGAMGYLLAHAAMFLAYDFQKVSQKVRSDWNEHSHSVSRLGVLALVSAPLGVVSFLSAMGDNIPRLILSSSGGLAALGVFAAFGYVIVGASALTIALGQVASPTLARTIASRDAHAFSRQILGLAGLASILGVAAVVLAALFGETFLDVFFGEEFAAFSFEFVIMAFYGWSLFVGSLLGAGLIAGRLYRHLLAIQILTVATITAIGFATIPGQGVRGAVVSLLIGGIVRVGSSAFVLLRFGRSLR